VCGKNRETNEHQQTGGRSSKDNLELLAALINKALNVAELIMKVIAPTLCSL